MASSSSNHKWRFCQVGGIDQPILDRGADLIHIDELDQKLWSALSCPVKGSAMDEQTLKLIDSDGDGRIRAPELIAAVQWLRGLILDPDGLLKGGPLPLKQINTASDEGKNLLSSAQEILTGLNKSDATVISVEDAEATAQVIANRRFNGDGVVPASSIQDTSARIAAQELLDCVGHISDRNNQPGFNQALLETFYNELVAYRNWYQLSITQADEIFPLGPNTPLAFDAIRAIREKIDDFFVRCRLVAFDPRALEELNGSVSSYVALGTLSLSSSTVELAAKPLSRVTPEGILDLEQGLNPAWSGPTEALISKVLTPLAGLKPSAWLNSGRLLESEWLRVKASFAAYETWMSTKAGSSVEKLGLERIEVLLSGNERAILQAEVDGDMAMAPAFNAISSVARLTRYYRDMARLLNNFVSFADFYSLKRPAIFQAGTLYLDERSMSLCLLVSDAGKHATLGALSHAYLVYCDIFREATGERAHIVAAVTDGDSGHIMAGRNGLFYDRLGKDWDATVVKVVDNPISVRAAFWSPYTKALAMAEGMFAKRAAAAEAESDKRMESATVSVSSSDIPAATPAVGDKKTFDVGTIAALGVAVGGITAALGALLQAFLGLGIWMPLGILAAILLISGPSMLLAWYKLRQRNLGPLLDANGWATNGRARINVSFGSALTHLAALPPGATKTLTDPFAEKKSIWLRLLVVLAVIAGVALGLTRVGVIPDWLGINAKINQKVVAPAAPAADAVPK